MIMVRFDTAQRGVVSVLEVEADHRRGLDDAIRAALFELRVQIVATRRGIAAGRRVRRLDVVEFDGGKLQRARQEQIAGRLFEVVAAARRPRRTGVRFTRSRRARAAA